MKKAVVIGATGGTGAAIVDELVRRQIPVTAFGRSRAKLEQLMLRSSSSGLITLAVGDAFQTKEVADVARGSDVLFHCANVPYHKMSEQLLPLGEAIMQAAEQLHVKVVAVDGIYPYGRRQADLITENHPKQPHTRKGKARLQFGKMILSPRWNNAKPLIVRLPDYYGPTANAASYLGATLRDIAANKPSFYIGNMRVPREYVYLPDAANMIVEIATRDDAYHQEWHIPGGEIISGQHIVRIARAAAGSSKPVVPLGKISLSILGKFNPILKEVVEMLYLTTEPLRLSKAKYETFIGPVPATSFEEGISQTIRQLKLTKVE